MRIHPANRRADLLPTALSSVSGREGVMAKAAQARHSLRTKRYLIDDGFGGYATATVNILVRAASDQGGNAASIDRLDNGSSPIFSG
jgi:hypothetical protein